MLDPGKYKDLDRKHPEDAATVVGVVERSIFFAHTIREIEAAILRIQGIHFHVITNVDDHVRIAAINFNPSGCDINLPCSDEENNLGFRLTLAHEIGHLIYNISKLKALMNMGATLDARSYTEEEQEYAWRFAKKLVLVKSKEYEVGLIPQFQKNIYTLEVVNQFLSAHLNGKIEKKHLKAILKS